MDEKFDNSISKKNRVLLHCCCAPCAAPALERFKQSDFRVDCFYFNPCIKPAEEYFKRLKQLQILCNDYGVRLIAADYEPDAFDNITKGMERQSEGGERCKICYEMRLSKAAQEAKRHSYDHFCTTLTLSPHKDSTVINTIGCRIALAQDITYLVSNFKTNNGNLISKEICTRLGLYRQNYCGCTPRT